MAQEETPGGPAKGDRQALQQGLIPVTEDAAAALEKSRSQFETLTGHHKAALARISAEIGQREKIQADLGASRAENESLRLELEGSRENLNTAEERAGSSSRELEAVREMLTEEKASSTVKVTRSQDEAKHLREKVAELVERLRGHAARAVERFKESKACGLMIAEAAIPLFMDGWTE